MVNLDDFTDSMREVYVFVRDHPDSGLYDIAEGLMETTDYEYRGTIDAFHVFKNRVSKRLNSLVNMGYLSRENPSGHMAVYRVTED